MSDDNDASNVIDLDVRRRRRQFQIAEAIARHPSQMATPDPPPSPTERKPRQFRIPAASEPTT